MTIMHIPIPDDLKEAFEKAYPGEMIERAVERWLREKVAVRSAISPATETMVEMARRIRAATPLTTNDEIRALRHEGRP